MFPISLGNHMQLFSVEDQLVSLLSTCTRNKAFCRKLVYLGSDEENDKKAREYYKKAGDKGRRDGWTNVALMLLQGEGGPADIPRGMRLLEQASDASGVACQNLGAIFLEGRYGQAENIDLALEYFVRGGQLGQNRALLLASMILWRKADAIRGTDPVEAAQLEHKGVLYVRQAADRGNFDLAQNNYGVILRDGLHGEPMDVAGAVIWLKKAAGQGNVTSMHALGEIYRTGKGAVRANAAESVYY
jgi:TPR repeat protein